MEVLNQSRYNSRLWVTHCEICGLKPLDRVDAGRNFDTHHILFQCTSDSCGRVDDGKRGRDELYNLVILCKTDHQKVHQGKIIINGWIKTSNGRRLAWNYTNEITNNSGRKPRLGGKVLTDDLREQIELYIEEYKNHGNMKHTLDILRLDLDIKTTKETLIRYMKGEI
jgi:DNA mismatch repair protein MutS